MPLYEYHCESCGKDHELIRKVAQADDPFCPTCEQEGLVRQTSQTAFQLKGGGWYADGYSEKKPEKKTEKKAPSSDTKKTGEGASRAKPSQAS